MREIGAHSESLVRENTKKTVGLWFVVYGL
jgi:hypothetical protein